VDRLHLLSEQFVMMTNRGIRKRYVVDLYKDTLTQEEANFPNEFDSVSDETHKVIGLDENKAKKVKAFEAEVKTYKESGKSYAENIFAGLFGEASLGLQLPELKEPESSHARKVTTPDEEEEISYTPSEDETLPDDDDSIVMAQVDAPSSRHGRDDRPQRDNRDQGQRHQQHNNQRNRDDRPQGNRPRQDNNNNRNRNNHNRGPRPPR
jgi:hypothetical protein